MSLWRQPDHLLVRIESSTTEERLRVSLHVGHLRETDQAEGEQAAWAAIAMDLRRVFALNT